MRYCPVCDERYDEEIIKFCTKDGTPLVDDGQPNFVILPSANADESVGEETVIRRKSPDESPLFGSSVDSERIVIPTSQSEEQRVRARQSQVFYPPPPPQNTAKTIILTIIGTLVILSFGAGLFWLFQKEPPTNTNVNTNPINLNTNFNTNGFNSNFNFNFNAATPNSNYASNYNYNINFNAVMKTPTNTPTPKQTPTPSPSPLFPSPSPTARTPANTRPPTSASPRPPTMMSNRPAGNRN